MLMLFPILAAMLVGGGYIYLVTRMNRLPILKNMAKENKTVSWVLSPLLVSLPWLFAFINVTAAVVAFLHLLVIWILCDLVGLVIRLIRKKGKDGPYLAGYFAILITIVYLGVGWFFAHSIFETHYELSTDKDLGGDLRIVEMADSHLGITLTGEDFANVCLSVQSRRPDLVVITGDFVDDDTKKADMERACQALGELETTYGVYFVLGNHDKGYFDRRDFTATELRECLEANGVTVLEDESVLVGGRFWLVGRRDRSDAGRAEASQLTAELDKDKYIVMLDHQPNDYDAEAASGADLVLSGHTHGGHIFPAGLIGLAIGANDKVYGTERRGGTDFVVTSGLSGWAIPFKTGAISEYVVIDVTQK